MAGRKYFRLSDRSTNAKHLEIIDEKSSPSDPTKFKISGEYLKMPKVDPSNPSQDPLELTLKCFLYGGQEEDHDNSFWLEMKICYESGNYLKILEDSL